MSKFLIAMLLMALAVPAFSADFDNGDPVVNGDDAMPWPWSTQCPFPWDKIEGNWHVVASNVDLYFDFIVVNQSEVGELYLVIKERDSEGNVIAEGLGVSKGGELGVRAAMRYLEGYRSEERLGHWLHISSFTKEEGNRGQLACYQTDVKTAVKITDFGMNQDKDDPWVIEKMLPPEKK